MKLLNRVLLDHPLPYLVVVVLSLAARGPTIATPLYSTDSYNQLQYGGIDPGFLLSQGRFGLAILVWLRDSLGYLGLEVAASSLILAMLLFAHSGLLLAHVILRKPTAAEVTIFLVLYSLHPFTTEFFFFSEVTLNIVLSLWVASVVMYVCSVIERPVLSIVVGTLGLALALSMYQTVIAQTLAVALLAVVARFAITESSPREPLMRSRQIRLVLASLASVPVYLLLDWAVRWVTGVSSNARAQFSELFADPLVKFATMVDAVSLAAWPALGLVSRLDATVLTGLLLMSTTALVWSMLRVGRWASAAVTLVLLSSALLWSAGFSSLVDTVWLVPRTMVGIAAFSAGLLMLGWRVRPGRPWRSVLVAGLVVLVIGYVGTSNRILFDQSRVNRWDMHQANRIITRLESAPGYADLRALAIVGGRWGYPVALSTTYGDMNISVMAVDYARRGLFEEATGYRFPAPTEGDVATAEAYCGTVEPWPDIGSVVVHQDLGIVCLPR